jgi:Zn-dependent oligopeptidase
VKTAFHEFGHALHGMFSNVKYPRFSGTNVPRDFVEYPSQVNEMWAVWPEVLANYAKHYKTGAPMPKELLDKVHRLEEVQPGLHDHRIPGRVAARPALAPADAERRSRPTCWASKRRR